MSKLYRVISTALEQYNVKVGDICSLLEEIDCIVAWFHNENWDDDGIWCLSYAMVEEVLETEV